MKKKTQFDKVEELIISILKNNKEPMEIHDLYNEVDAEDSMNKYEFRYALCHQLSTGEVKLSLDRMLYIDE